MTAFFQVAGGVLLTAVLCLTLNKQNKDISAVLGIGVVCMVLSVMSVYLEPVLDFVRQLQQVGDLDGDLLEIPLKAVGIGLIAEVAGLICTDAGKAALGKGLQILAASVVLWLSLPLMRSLLELIQSMMGEI